MMTRLFPPPIPKIYPGHTPKTDLQPKKMHVRCSPLSESESKPSTFKGSALVSALLEIDRNRFKSRAVALHFARRLFRLGLVRSIFGASNFEDSVQVYCWHNGNDKESHHSGEPRCKSNSNVGQRSSWMTNAKSSPTLSNNCTNSYYNSNCSKRLHSSPHQHTDQNQTKNRPHVNSHFVDIVRTKLLSIGEPTALDPTSDSLEGNQTKSRTDHDLSWIRKSSKAFQLQTCTTPHSFTPVNSKKKAVALSSSHVYQDRVISTRHKHNRSPKMDDVATAKYLNEKDIFALDFDTSSKTVETQVFQMCRDDCEIPSLRLSGGSSTGSNPGNGVGVGGRNVWSSVGVVDSGGGCGLNNGAGSSNGGGGGGGGSGSSCGGSSNGGVSGVGGGGGGRASGGVGNGGCSEPCSSYSDNEKQLIEEINRIKRDHEHVLRTYEDRISRMTDKMHELRNIAEMLENSSNKSLPYGVLPAAKSSQSALQNNNAHQPNNNNNNNNQNQNHHLNHHNHNNHNNQHHLQQQQQQQQQNGNPSSITCHAPGHCIDPEAKSSTQHTDKIAPPPLPPRNDRGTAKVYPNKPLVHSKVKLSQVPWTRIITNPDDENMKGTIWNTLGETDIDTPEIERFFEESPTKATVFIQSLYDDVSMRCGPVKPQPISIIDSTKCQQMAQQMKQVRCTFSDVVHALLTLSIETLRFANADSLSELFQLMSSGNDIEIIGQQDRRISNVPMDCPEYFLYELSGMEMLRERLDFLRFKLRFLTDLFETDQRLRAVNAACDELYNSLPLKNLLEVMVCVGNYMNGGTPLGQADGFQLDILPKLKDVLAKNNKSNFLEYVITVYCQKFENEPGLQTNRTFRLPNALVVRYASQISFDEMQKNLQGWKNELINTRNKIHSNLVMSTSRQVEGFRNAVDYFLNAGMETMEEQKKFLYDTKDYCIKVLSYFSFDMNVQGSVQQFFLMWSQFLHECKHYWKISHQRLAEERFRKGLNQKIKMMNVTNMEKFTIPSSCPDLPPRIRKQKTSTEKPHPPPPPVNIPIKKWEGGSCEDLRFHHHHNGCTNGGDGGGHFHHHHHHVSSNTLPASIPCNANSHHQVHHIKTYKSREDLRDFQAQPSPKPLTSRPPNNSDIHKPKPLNPMPTSHEGSPLLGLCHKVTNNIASHNYMNQSPLAVRPTSSPVVANSGTTTNPMEVAEVAPKRPPPHHLHNQQANNLASRETAGVAVPSTTTTPMVPSVSNSNSSSSHHHHHTSSTATSLSSSGGSNKNSTNNSNNSTSGNGHIESTSQKKSTHQLFKSWLKREQTKTSSSDQGNTSSKISSNDKSKLTAFKPVNHGSEEPVRAPKIYTRAKTGSQTSTLESQDGHHSSHDLTLLGNSSKNGPASHGQDHGHTEPKQFQSHSNSLTNKTGSKDQLFSPRYEQSPVSSSEKLTLANEKKTAKVEEKSQHQTARNHYQHFSGPPSPQKSNSDPGSWNNGGHLPPTSLTPSASSHRNYQNDVELITASSTTPKHYSSNNHTGQPSHYINSNNTNNKPRDRAPLSLDNNVGISDVHQSEPQSKNEIIESVAADQTNEKHSNHPVSTGQGHLKNNITTASSMVSYAHEIQTKSRKYFTTNAAQQSTTNNMSGVLGCRSQSSQILKNLSGATPDLRGSGTQGSSLPSSGHGNGTNSSGQHRSSSAYSYSQKMAREEAAAAAASPRSGYHTEGRSSKLATGNGDRIPTSAPSISSLIERFEKVQHVGESSAKHTLSKSNEANNCDLKHMVLSSTRKRLFGEPTASNSTQAGINKPKSNPEHSNSSEDEYAVQLDRAVSPLLNHDLEEPIRRHRCQTMDVPNGRKPAQNEYTPINGENPSSLLRNSNHPDNFDPTNEYSSQLRETAKNTNILQERYPNIQQTPERPPPLVTSSAAIPLANQKGHNKRIIRAHENMAYMAV